jgi:hypothetical protein
MMPPGIGQAFIHLWKNTLGMSDEIIMTVLQVRGINTFGYVACFFESKQNIDSTICYSPF